MQAVDPRNKAIKALAHIAKRQAATVYRRLPASIDVQDLEQSALIAIAKAVENFDGRGSLEAFCARRARFAIFDFLRQTHPAGRNGPQVHLVSDDECADLADDFDHAQELINRRHLQSRLKDMKPMHRETVEKVLSGQAQKDVARAMGLSESAVSLRLSRAVQTPESGRSSPLFDPDAVPIKTGEDFPMLAPAGRVNKSQKMALRMPATGWVELAHKPAQSLTDYFKRSRIAYISVKASLTTTIVIREPSDAQKIRAGRKA